MFYLMKISMKTRFLVLKAFFDRREMVGKTDIQIETYAERQMDRWMDRQADRQMDRQTDGWMERQLDRQTDR